MDLLPSRRSRCLIHISSSFIIELRKLNTMIVYQLADGIYQVRFSLVLARIVVNWTPIILDRIVFPLDAIKKSRRLLHWQLL